VTFLLNPTPPRLPDPDSTGDFNPRSRMALLQALRLYFEQLNNTTQALLGRNGARFLETPTASYYADDDQATLAGTPLPVRFPLFTNQQGFTKPTVSQIRPVYAGTYYMQATLHYANTSGTDRLVSAWLTKNNVDVQTTRVDITVPGNDIQTVSINYMIDLLPTDILEVMMFAASSVVTLHAPVAAGPLPRGAAARWNIFLISNDSTAAVSSLAHRLKKQVFDPPA